MHLFGPRAVEVQHGKGRLVLLGAPSLVGAGLGLRLRQRVGGRKPARTTIVQSPPMTIHPPKGASGRGQVA